MGGGGGPGEGGRPETGLLLLKRIINTILINYYAKESFIRKKYAKRPKYKNISHF